MHAGRVSASTVLLDCSLLLLLAAHYPVMQLQGVSSSL